MIRSNKKGALQLSINAIVVLILAITMLGLGLGFMRNIFGSATEEFQDVSGTIQKQMVDGMKETNKIVDLSNPKIQVKPGEKETVFIAYKNEGNIPINFQIQNVHASKLGQDKSFMTNVTIDPTSGDISQLPLNSGPCGVRGIESGTMKELPASSEIYLEFKRDKTEVAKGSVRVLPLNIISKSTAKSGTCFYELKVDTDGNDVYDKILELAVDISS